MSHRRSAARILYVIINLCNPSARLSVAAKLLHTLGHLVVALPLQYATNLHQPARSVAILYNRLIDLDHARNILQQYRQRVGVRNRRPLFRLRNVHRGAQLLGRLHLQLAADVGHELFQPRVVHAEQREYLEEPFHRREIVALDRFVELLVYHLLHLDRRLLERRNRLADGRYRSAHIIGRLLEQRFVHRKEAIHVPGALLKVFLPDRTHHALAAELQIDQIVNPLLTLRHTALAMETVEQAIEQYLKGPI